MGVKHKTSVNIDKDIWREWNHFVIDATGSARKVSEQLEMALVDYMKNHKVADEKSRR